MSWTNDTKPAGETSYLLWEVGSYLLVATGEKLIIEQAGAWTSDTTVSASWTNDTI